MSTTNQQARRLPLLHINADERHALDTFGEWSPQWPAPAWIATSLILIT